jgi:hypothetical protein
MPSKSHNRSHVGAIILILVGVVFLLINFGIAPAAEIKILFAQWWPLILVIIGVWLIWRPRNDAQEK